ncbi:MAG: ImmA/IrrE family metallo-endopeptidase [Patescibacteria group bacterium]
MESDLPDLGPRKTLAKNLAQRLVKDVGISEAPVSLQRIIEHVQTTRPLDVHRIDAGQKVSGLLVVVRKVDAEYATIGFNGNHSWYRRRFTIAHEIGHLLLGHTCTGNQNDGSYNEKEAHLFAGELLIPTALIKKDFKKLHDLKALSKLYRMSESALTMKLMEARLV